MKKILTVLIGIALVGSLSAQSENDKKAELLKQKLSKGNYECTVDSSALKKMGNNETINVKVEVVNENKESQHKCSHATQGHQCNKESQHKCPHATQGHQCNKEAQHKCPPATQGHQCNKEAQHKCPHANTTSQSK